MPKRRPPLDERIMAIVGDSRAKALMALRILATADWVDEDSRQAAREVLSEMAAEGFDFSIAAGSMH